MAAAGPDVADRTDSSCLAGDVAIVGQSEQSHRQAFSPPELRRAGNWRGGLLMVDEAFVDSCLRRQPRPRPATATIVLRSFGKTYGLAGVRLGFAIGETPSSLGFAAKSDPGPCRARPSKSAVLHCLMMRGCTRRGNASTKSCSGSIAS